MEMASRDEDVSLLITMLGIGIYSAMLIKAEIADISRFQHHTNLVSYAGLNPSIKSSGDSIYHGRITKQLRWILVQCANVAIRNDEYIRNFYERIKARKEHNVAIVATARKMLVCVYYMLTRRDAYNPYR
ncbi:MAG: transposase [Methanocellales archaeon]|nr:transposase [Methanocellales archaeon]